MPTRRPRHIAASAISRHASMSPPAVLCRAFYFAARRIARDALYHARQQRFEASIEASSGLRDFGQADES